jgi:hypothetical protein
MTDLPMVWGATADEVARPYPADTLLDGPVLLATRAVGVDAPTSTVYRWLCQVAVAPYSYDWLDNLGRRSPRRLTPGADDLHVGKVMTVFAVTGFEPGHSWSGVMAPRARRVFGPVAITYAAEPDGGSSSRIVCRLAVPDGGLLSRTRAKALAWGDLVMMRKQLLTFKDLAERDARRGTRA